MAAVWLLLPARFPVLHAVPVVAFGHGLSYAALLALATLAVGWKLQAK